MAVQSMPSISKVVDAQKFIFNVRVEVFFEIWRNTVDPSIQKEVFAGVENRGLT